ncbi:hypothetical protein LY78DRAFT_661989 [Colletotrichum sublineola]|nr:hypothetical protein LY78DRAFT_661989 [Colletotrichum sublineola]
MNGPRDRYSSTPLHSLPPSRTPLPSQQRRQATTAIALPPPRIEVTIYFTPSLQFISIAVVPQVHPFRSVCTIRQVATSITLDLEWEKEKAKSIKERVQRQPSA